MGRIYINELGQYAGMEVQLHGWLYHKRSSGKVRFLTHAGWNRSCPVRHGQGTSSRERF